ncbi:hypothetical protein LCGC14_1393050 [marine sediment metagenome]|uniref:Uncharacterized protein n=1 Tax=marine sediment metagenome TaxID=412755 RepID=A0A0F9KK55_9ZZZZ
MNDKPKMNLNNITTTTFNVSFTCGGGGGLALAPKAIVFWVVKA